MLEPTRVVGVPAEFTCFVGSDYPALYHAADFQSLEGQRRYLTATRLRLAVVVLAAATGLGAFAVDGIQLLGIVGAVALAAAMGLELYLRNVRPDRIWYDGRAAAESAKSLTWRYVAGGNPFPISLGTAADAAFAAQVAEVMHVVPGTHLVPDDHSGEQITPRMRNLRTSALPIRRAAYRDGRIVDQRSWYGQRARENEQSSRRWSTFLVAAEIVGVGAAILRAADVVDVDATGVTAALIAAVVAWVETRQHRTLASAYAVAHHELGLIEAQIDDSVTEEGWARFVDESEEAISREHRLWRASRKD